VSGTVYLLQTAKNAAKAADMRRRRAQEPVAA
jgi:hypothetical protein